MIKVTQTQRTNLLHALNVMWPRIEPEQIVPGLETYFSEDGSCGSTACFGGHVAREPFFKEQGVRVNQNHMPEVYGTGLTGCEVAGHLFGLEDLFEVRGMWPWAEGKASLDYKDLTDHEIVTARLTWLLNNSEVQP